MDYNLKEIIIINTLYDKLYWHSEYIGQLLHKKVFR